MDVSDFLERAGCTTEQEFMDRLALCPSPDQRRIIMIRIGLLPFQTYTSLEDIEGVSRCALRARLKAGLKRMKDNDVWTGPKLFGRPIGHLE